MASSQYEIVIMKNQISITNTSSGKSITKVANLAFSCDHLLVSNPRVLKFLLIETIKELAGRRRFFEAPSVIVDTLNYKLHDIEGLSLKNIMNDVGFTKIEFESFSDCSGTG
jgi:hypothetical protein